MTVVFRVYVTFLFAVTGAVMGSFLNCWAMRWAKGERYPRGRSACPKCGHTLGAADLVPIFSWIFLRGRCRYCGERVSARYPLTEIIGAGVFAGIWLRFGLTAYTAELCIFTACLFLLALIDSDTMILPNGPMLAAAAAWCVFLMTHEDRRGRAVSGLITAFAVGAALLAVSLVMDRVLKRESLGGGDIKLMALAALYLGPWGTLLTVILSCILGLVCALVLGARDRAFPFGPAICAGTWLVLMFGEPVIQWYLGLL